MWQRVSGRGNYEARSQKGGAHKLQLPVFKPFPVKKVGLFTC